MTLYHSSLFVGQQGEIKHIWLLEINSSYQDWYTTYGCISKAVIYANCPEMINHLWDNYKLELIQLTDICLDYV